MSEHLTITLLSDLGTRHTAHGSARATLYSALPDAEVIDISHRVAPYNLQQAAYHCRNAYRHFPLRTFHLLMVDIMHGERHRMLLAEADGHYFIAPDNGILALTFGTRDLKVWLCKEFSDPAGVNEWVKNAAGVMQTVSRHTNINELFIQFHTKHVGQLLTQKPIGDRIDCAILHIDNYGNVVIDLSRHQFDELAAGGPFSIALPPEQEINELSRHYNDVADGHLLCRFNKAGLMELSVNRGSFAERFGFQQSADKGINYGVITVNF